MDAPPSEKEIDTRNTSRSSETGFHSMVGAAISGGRDRAHRGPQLVDLDPLLRWCTGGATREALSAAENADRSDSASRPAEDLNREPIVVATRQNPPQAGTLLELGER